MDKKTMLIWGVIVVIIFAGLITYGICYKKAHPYMSIESNLKDAAKEYMENYDGIKPDSMIDLTITSKVLYEAEYITKDKLKYKGKECSGKVVVSNDNGKYKYTPTVKCE